MNRFSSHSSESDTVPIIHYVGTAVIAGLLIAWGLTAYDNRQARTAQLAQLSPGHRFPGCDEVRARGLAPLRRGEPGYGEHMDGDGDGIACEPIY